MAIDLGTTVDGRARRRLGRAAPRPTRPSRPSCPLDIDDPAPVEPGLGPLRGRRGRRAAPDRPVHRQGHHHPAGRRRPVVQRGARGRGGPGARLRRARRSSWPSSASGPSSGPPACRAGSWTSSPRPPASRATRCSSTATTLEVTPVAVPDDVEVRRRSTRPGAHARRLGLRRAPGRRPRRPRPSSARSATPHPSTLDALDDPVLRRPGPPRDHRERPGAAVRRGPRPTADLREAGRAHGRQPRQPPRRLRGVDPGARRARRPARRPPPGCTAPASPAPASVAASWPSPSPAPSTEGWLVRPSAGARVHRLTEPLMRSSSSAFWASNSPSVEDAALVQARRASRSARRRVLPGRRPSAGAGALPRDPVELAVLVGLHLLVDLVLHDVGLADVLEAVGAVSPADSISRSPAPTMRSKKPWWKKTVLIRSSGISMPRLVMTPLR